MTAPIKSHHWTGPALFTYGFRPFFLFGAIWAALAMILWITMLSGITTIPTQIDPVSWHAHEFLFGYLGAIIAGFLLTAVPNWTGRLPIIGWHLAMLFALWLLGRVAFSMSALLPKGFAETIDLVFPLVLALTIFREIVTARKWGNLVVLGLLAVFILANLLFHLEAAQGDIAARGLGLRLGVATIVMMISLIGGRIIPAFTRNWLTKVGRTDLPPAPMQPFDKATLLGSVVALCLWVLFPTTAVCGIALMIMGGLQVIRIARWRGLHTLSEPLLSVLHLGYVSVPLGGLMTGFATLFPEILEPSSAQHIWMAGFALMTLAVMIRATLGHTGQELHIGPSGILIFAAIFGAIFMRLIAGIWPDHAMMFYTISALLWVGAFVGFCILFGASLVKATPS